MEISLYSSLKIVALMLVADGEVSPEEKKWFIRIGKNYGANFHQRRYLLSLLKGRSKVSVEDLITTIDDDDRTRLLNLLRMAMKQDGLVKNNEMQLFHRVESLLAGKATTHEYLQLGKSLLERDRSINFWKELDNFGIVMNTRRTHLFDRRLNQVDSFIYRWIFDSSRGRRLKVAVFFFIIIFLIIRWSH